MTEPVLLLNILLSAISDCAYALAVGLILAAFLTPQSDKTTPLKKWLLSIAAIMLLAQSLRPWFLAASMSGSPSFAENFALIPSILSSTHQGTLWKINIFAILALFVSIGSIGVIGQRRRNAIYAAAISLTIIAFVKAASGHAANDGDFSLLEIIQFLHILATALWAGAIIVTGFLSLPVLRRAGHRNETLWNHLQSVSTIATYAIIIILASGLYTGDRELAGPLTTLWSSTWGKILTAKVLVVLVALALGASNRFICLAKGISTERLTLSSRLMQFEALAMLIILVLSGWLGNTSPIMQ
jgi:putative copper resistance protein D